MHIKDGFIDPTIAIATFAATLIILAVSWRKVKTTYTQSFAAVLAVSSAFVFAAQLLNFPVTIGTSVHLVGGTFLAVLLGPFAALISMTLVVGMQAFFFADGGISTMGANLFNMTLTCILGYALVKLLTRRAKTPTGFALGVFAASWVSVMAGALAAGLEIGFSAVAAPAGGILFVVPSLMGFYAIAGLVEGAVTASLLVSLQRFQPTVMVGLNVLRTKTGT